LTRNKIEDKIAVNKTLNRSRHRH